MQTSFRCVVGELRFLEIVVKRIAVIKFEWTMTVEAVLESS